MFVKTASILISMPMNGDKIVSDVDMKCSKCRNWQETVSIYGICDEIFKELLFTIYDGDGRVEMVETPKDFFCVLFVEKNHDSVSSNV